MNEFTTEMISVGGMLLISVTFNVCIILVLIHMRGHVLSLRATLEEVHEEVNSRLTRTQDKLDASIRNLATSQEKLEVSLT